MGGILRKYRWYVLLLVVVFEGFSLVCEYYKEKRSEITGVHSMWTTNLDSI